MSSLSLPRALHQRKTSLEQERENFEKFQATSIGKAINNIESPVKEKHVRIAIIGTFRDKSPELFWQYVLKLPLQENRIIAWKFCHVLHKLLRDGHPQTIPHSQKHKSRIADLGKLWYHLKEGYGKLIYQYCQLLIVKLDFHLKNPRFPGNLLVSNEELQRIGENDINNYFQMSVEMFDYMDEILALQEAIFGSLDMSRSNSMTSSGQCRLAPLIQCIQDSLLLYDYCVKILFKLYAHLSADLLAGHRTRFLKQFERLRQFYLFSSNLQYFKNLIQIPLLPDNPPNILVQSELRSYITPVVIMPQQPDEPDGTSFTSDLIDITGESSQDCSRSMSPVSMVQKDDTVDHLQNELSGCQMFINQLKRKIILLEGQISEKEDLISELQNDQETMSKRLEELSKIPEYEERAKVCEEKFFKLKDVYSKLREEHIQLIRQKAEIEKALKGSDKITKFARAANNLILSIKADVDKQLASVKSLDFEVGEQTKLQENLATLQATADAATEQNEALIRKVEWTEKENLLLESKVQELVAVKNKLEGKLHDVENQQTKEQNCLSDQCQMIIEQMSNAIKNRSFDSITSLTDILEYFQEHLSSILQKKKKGDIILVTHLTATIMLLSKATANMIPVEKNKERLIDLLQRMGEEMIKIIETSCKDMTSPLLSNCHGLCTIIDELSLLYPSAQNGNLAETLSSLVENELTTMDKAIEEAAKQIEEMLQTSRVADSGLKLEVNGKILNSCTNLMKTISVLVQKARILQAEIVASGNAVSNLSAKEFYKRNHQWTEGLISAAKAVGMGAKLLLTAADDVVSSNGKLECLIVASQSVAAGTAQLVVASRVKADRNSVNLLALSSASKDVTNAAGNVVATVKSCAHLVEESDDLDFLGLSQHQAKRLEMDSQVRVLELEAHLEKERLKLAALRRYHYQLSDDTHQS